MNSLLLLSTFGVSLIAILGLWKPAEGFVRRIYAWVPLAALLLAVLSVQQQRQEISLFPNFLLGARIGLDSLGRAFLVLTSTVWLLAGLFSRKYFSGLDHERIFRFYFLLTFSGTAGLTIAQDAPSFYAGYALMTIGGYGLVVNTMTSAALLAGRVYIIVALIGEMLTLAGMIIAASSAEATSLEEIARSIKSSGTGAWSFWLIFLGFGTKVGLVPLHFWLPRSYFWAPVPAVAVLSGAMTKAGVLGWLRFLNGFESDLASLMTIAAGTLMALYGVVFGLVQTRAKTTLAFSSLCQMGYLTIAFATTVEPGAPVTKSVAAITAFAFHHGLTKVALFLGLSVLATTRPHSRKHWIALSGLALCALSLVGIPFTAGAFAKALLKEAGSTAGFWAEVASPVMTVGAIGTALLMLRFLVLCKRGEKDQVHPTDAWITWGISLVMVLGGAWLLPALLSALELSTREPLSLGESLPSFLPVAAGGLLAAALTYKVWRRRTHLSPRPFDTILQTAYKAVWEDFPRGLDRFIDSGSYALLRFRRSLRLERKAQRIVTFALALHTGWLAGCTLFIAIGVLLWGLLAGGGS